MKTRAAEYWVIAILSFGALFFIKQVQTISNITLPGGIGPRTFPLITFWAILILNLCLLGGLIWEKIGAKKAAPPGEGVQTKLLWRIVPYIPRKTLFVFHVSYWSFSGGIGFYSAFLFVTGASLLLVQERSLWRSLVLAGVSWRFYSLSTSLDRWRKVKDFMRQGREMKLLLIFNGLQ